jgi:histone acetyltransferase (RNA polymerase elongator complex component)
MTPRRRIVPVFVPHLGCPHRCVFCDQKTISGMQQPAGPDTVRETLRSAQALSAWAELAFYGGSFTAIPWAEQRALLEAAQPFRESGFLTSIRLSTRPDAVTEAGLERLKAYGVETVELGAQSMEDRVLRLSGRGHRAEDTVRAASLVKASGMGLVLQMMTGLPGASPELDYHTAEALAALQPDGVRVYPTVILRSTALEALWRAGKYRAHTVSDAVETCAPIAALFLRAGIPILRLGLNPTEALSGGEAVGGAYHPALGELVYSKLYLDLAREKLRALPRRPRQVELLVASSRVSQMTGRKKSNLLALRWEFGLEGISVSGGAFPPETVEIGKILW